MQQNRGQHKFVEKVPRSLNLLHKTEIQIPSKLQYTLFFSYFSEYIKYSKSTPALLMCRGHKLTRSCLVYMKPVYYLLFMSEQRLSGIFFVLSDTSVQKLEIVCKMEKERMKFSVLVPSERRQHSFVRNYCLLLRCSRKISNAILKIVHLTCYINKYEHFKF